MICKLLTQGAADGIFCWLDSTALYKAVSTNLGKIPWNNIQVKISFYNPENTKAFFGQGQSCTINPALLARQGDALMVKDGTEPVSMTTLQMPTTEITQLLKIANKNQL